MTAQFTDKVRDEGSLREYREAISRRAERAKAQLRERSSPGSVSTRSRRSTRHCRPSGSTRQLAFVALYEGDHDEAAAWLEEGAGALEDAGRAGLGPGAHDGPAGHQRPAPGRAGQLHRLRRPVELHLPDRPRGGPHPAGGLARGGRWFTAYLDEWPGDLRVRWLLNIAAMTLGEYPDKVPPRYLIPVAPFRSKPDLGRFENVATLVGLVARRARPGRRLHLRRLHRRRPPRLFTTSFDVVHGASLYVNRGDGRFEDRSRQAGLDDQVYALNVTRADYDNDGRLDVLLLRGAWEKPAPMSLAAEQGGRGLRGRDGRPAAWASRSPPSRPPGATTTTTAGSTCSSAASTGSCRPGIGRSLVAAAPTPGTAAGSITTRGTARSSTSPRRPACRTSDRPRARPGATTTTTAGSTCSSRTWTARPGSTATAATARFVDVAPELGVVGPPHGFTCMFWDYDDDGRLDIFVADYSSNLAEVVADLPRPARCARTTMPTSITTSATGGFREVSREAGLARPMPVMSVNAGDIDNDGDLDLHLGTGWMSLSGLVPDLMYANVGGRFEDVTESTGTGHLQKGHGVSFADWDDDGDLDLFVVLGGGYPGDRGYNALFQNPGHGHHWLKVRLVGTQDQPVGDRRQARGRREAGPTAPAPSTA